MDYRDIITIEPGKRSGKPCIRGTRMTVTDVLEYLASGAIRQEALELAMAAASVVIHQIGTTGTASVAQLAALLCPAPSTAGL